MATVILLVSIAGEYITVYDIMNNHRQIRVRKLLLKQTLYICNVFLKQIRVDISYKIQEIQML